MVFKVPVAEGGAGKKLVGVGGGGVGGGQGAPKFSLRQCFDYALVWGSLRLKVSHSPQPPRIVGSTGSMMQVVY